MALAYAGAKVVIAKSFARIFFRNCVNMGLLLPIVYPHDYDESVIGKEVAVHPAELRFEVEGDPRLHRFADFGPLARIIEAGGLTPFTKKRLEATR